MALLEVVYRTLPGKPAAYNNGLLSINYGLLWGIVAYCFRLLGFPGTSIFQLFGVYCKRDILGFPGMSILNLALLSSC